MVWLAVAIGGALGALSRYGLIHLMPHTTHTFPWAVWYSNLLGSAVIGLLYVLIVEKGIISAEWRPFLMVGFLGALTTFSSFALDGILLLHHGHFATALSYIISSLAGCFLCVAAAVWLARLL